MERESGNLNSSIPGILSRLGQAVYWLSCAIAWPVIGFATYESLHDKSNDLHVFAAVAIAAIAVWLVGMATRYVLAGPGPWVLRTVLLWPAMATSGVLLYAFVFAPEPTGPWTKYQQRQSTQQLTAASETGDVLVWDQQKDEWVPSDLTVEQQQALARARTRRDERRAAERALPPGFVIELPFEIECPSGTRHEVMAPDLQAAARKAKCP